MDKINIEIKNGYGIERLKHTFVFNGNLQHPQQNTNIIYAQNGVMKSSFAKSLYDYSKDIPIKDHIFDVSGSCKLKDENGDVNAKQVFSVASFDNGEFESQKIAELLVSADLRKKYNIHMDRFNDAFSVLIDHIRKVSKINPKLTSQEIVGLICGEYGETIPKNPQNLINILKSNRKEIENRPDYIQNVPYSVLGANDTLKFANDNKGIIEELMAVYDEIKTSASFVRGKFDSGNARKLVDIVGKTDFLNVSHEIELFNKSTGKHEKVVSLEVLEEKLATDVDRILAQKPALKKKFEKMIADLSTATRTGLKNVLEANDTKDIILLMNSPTSLRRSMWEGYLKACLEEVDLLLLVQEEIKEPIGLIIDEAMAQSTDWDTVVKKFNHRFRNLPYEIEIENKSSVMLEGVTEPKPVIRYRHPRQRDKRFISLDERHYVSKYLSTGERKALYLLNVMFEIEAAQKSGEKHVVILDDIVDSFDYKNKYAFLEYLYEISKEYDQIKLMVLTHNYDFFRLLQSRLFGDNYRDHSWFAVKTNTDTEIIKAEHFRVFGYMRERAQTDKRMWLSMIPFARNLAEYRCDDPLSSNNYTLLTECLHNLDAHHTVRDIKAILLGEVGIDRTPFKDEERIEDILLDEANVVASEPSVGINLHNNLILAMASRWLAEDYMKSQLTAEAIAIAKSSKSIFTRKLYDALFERNNETAETLDLLDQVNLITPEHIHVNSFMYEPLIDISFDEIKALYLDLKSLISSRDDRREESIT